MVPRLFLLVLVSVTYNYTLLYVYASTEAEEIGERRELKSRANLTYISCVKTINMDLASLCNLTERGR